MIYKKKKIKEHMKVIKGVKRLHLVLEIDTLST